MTIKKYFVTFITIIGISYVIITTFLMFYCDTTSKTEAIEPLIEAIVYKVDKGYGYTLIKNNQRIIQQDYIPAISGRQPFCSIEDAKNTAELVKKKIINNQTPKVTIDDLNKLKLSFNCLSLY